jgi:hypothetical protein
MNIQVWMKVIQVRAGAMRWVGAFDIQQRFALQQND